MPMDTFGFVANKVITNYGVVNVVLNRHMPVDKILVVDPAYLRLVYLRKPAFEMLAKMAITKGMVITECSLKVLNSCCSLHSNSSLNIKGVILERRTALCSSFLYQNFSNKKVIYGK